MSCHDFLITTSLGCIAWGAVDGGAQRRCCCAETIGWRSGQDFNMASLCVCVYWCWLCLFSRSLLIHCIFCSRADRVRAWRVLNSRQVVDVFLKKINCFIVFSLFVVLFNIGASSWSATCRCTKHYNTNNIIINYYYLNAYFIFH